MMTVSTLDFEGDAFQHRVMALDVWHVKGVGYSDLLADRPPIVRHLLERLDVSGGVQIERFDPRAKLTLQLVQCFSLLSFAGHINLSSRDDRCIWESLKR